MKLARVIRSAEGVWQLVRPSGSVRKPPRGTLVRYDVYGDTFRVYFPGVQGYAPMGEERFNVCFEPL